MSAAYIETQQRGASSSGRRRSTRHLYTLILMFGILGMLFAAPVQAQTIAPAEGTDMGVPGAGVTAVAGLDGADLLTEANGKTIVHVEPGRRLDLTGRSLDQNWLLVKTINGQHGWVAAADVMAFGVEQLPISEEIVALPFLNKEIDAAKTEIAPHSGTEEPRTHGATKDQIVEETVLATVALADSRLNVRADADAGSVIVGKLYPGESYAALGQDATGAWLLLQIPAIEGQIGWVAAQYMTLDAEVDVLPVTSQKSDARAYAEPTSDGQTVSTSAIPAGLTTVAAPSANGAELSGTLVFQTSNGGMIYAHDLASGNLRPLTVGFDPAVSPDGTLVAFTRDGGENGLYTIGIDGENERLLFSGRAGLRSPKWSPDGQSIVFTRGDEYVECYEMGRLGCPTEDEFKSRFPFLSTSDYPLVKEYRYKLAVVDANGNNYRDLATLDSAQAPDWNEAGVVYQSAAGLQLTDDAPGAENRLVSFDYLKPFYRDPDWQSGGGKIAFQSREGSHWEIWTVNPDGSEMVALTRPKTTLVDELPSNVAPAWSPDGEQIAFLSNRDDDGSAGAWRLWVMNSDGSDQRPLALDLEFAYGFGNEQMVSWGK